MKYVLVPLACASIVYATAIESRAGRSLVPTWLDRRAEKVEWQLQQVAAHIPLSDPAEIVRTARAHTVPARRQIAQIAGGLNRPADEAALEVYAEAKAAGSEWSEKFGTVGGVVIPMRAPTTGSFLVAMVPQPSIFDLTGTFRR